MGKIEITQEEYDKLIDIKDRMLALQNAGVDNWEGYDIALDEYNEKVKKREKFLKLLHEIEDIICNSEYEVDPAGRGTGVAIHADMQSISKLIDDYIKELQSPKQEQGAKP